MHLLLEKTWILWVILQENTPKLSNFLVTNFNIVSMGVVSSIHRSCLIGFNVKIYYRAGKEWIEEVSVLKLRETLYNSIF